MYSSLRSGVGSSRPPLFGNTPHRQTPPPGPCPGQILPLRQKMHMRAQQLRGLGGVWSSGLWVSRAVCGQDVRRPPWSARSTGGRRGPRFTRGGARRIASATEMRTKPRPWQKCFPLRRGSRTLEMPHRPNRVKTTPPMRGRVRSAAIPPGSARLCRPLAQPFF